MSANIYVISDLHLSHHNMAISRGFDNIEQHDNHIIDSWNKVINKQDTVWILGDITMEKSGPYELLSKLKGYKRVILGNHDQPQHIQELKKYVNSICAYHQYKHLMLSHIPIHPSEFEYRINKNIHGHLHFKNIMKCGLIKDDRYVNVCCEQVNYTPVLLKSLL